MYPYFRFWWSLLSEVDWWDAVGCTQSAVEDNLGKFFTQQIVCLNGFRDGNFAQS
jgi:hypothetical protein